MTFFIASYKDQTPHPAKSEVWPWEVKRPRQGMHISSNVSKELRIMHRPEGWWHNIPWLRPTVKLWLTQPVRLNAKSNHRGQNHLWWLSAFSCDVTSQITEVKIISNDLVLFPATLLLLKSSEMILTSVKRFSIWMRYEAIKVTKKKQTKKTWKLTVGSTRKEGLERYSVLENQTCLNKTNSRKKRMGRI